MGDEQERREADLFYADLMGVAPVGRRAGEQLGEDDLRMRRVLGPDTLAVFLSAFRRMRTEQQVRNAIVAAARAESRRWHTSAGAPIFESEPSMFGNLVRYNLAVLATVPPPTLLELQAAAIAPTTSYGALPTTSSASTVNSEVTRVSAVLMAAVTDPRVPANLATLVSDALRHARDAHRDSGAHSAWSAVFVCACVRSVAIALELEAMVRGSQVGRDVLLRATGRHWEYAATAYQRRNQQLGTYHAYDPTQVAPQPGDIIVQDRRSAGGFTFAQMPPHAMNAHGDIVIEVSTNDVITLGGNLGSGTARQESVRRRRFPRAANGRLVVDATRSYSQEDNSGNLPPLPAAVAATGSLGSRSTARIFTLLQPRPSVIDVPQRTPAGTMLA